VEIEYKFGESQSVTGKGLYWGKTLDSSLEDFKSPAYYSRKADFFLLLFLRHPLCYLILLILSLYMEPHSKTGPANNEVFWLLNLPPGTGPDKHFTMELSVVVFRH
jgi:hypothetical protein